MNAAQIQGIIRWVLTIAGGGWAIRNLSTDQVDTIVNQIATILGSVAALASLGWSIYSNHKSQLASQLAKSKQ